MARCCHRVFLAFCLLIAGGCGSTYTLVKSGTVAVARKAFTVDANSEWNRVPGDRAVRQQEVWTRNGPALDRITFIGGLPDGKALVSQHRKDARQVMPFRAAMSPIDMTSMLESLYRVRGDIRVFELGAVQPTRFLGVAAMDVSFRYTAGDELPRRGRAVMAVIGNKLYAMQLDAAASHYFDAARPEFEAMVESALLRR